MSKPGKKVWFYLLMALLGWLLALALNLTTPVRNAELASRDRFMESRGPLSVEESPIVLVAISETADNEIPEKWPWPLDLHARLIRNLNQAGAKAIVFDVLFTQPDIYDPANDTLFAEALNTYNNVILAGDFNPEIRTFSKERSLTFPLPLFREANPNPTGLVNTNPYSDGVIRSYPLVTVHQDSLYFMLGLQALRVFHGLPEGSMPDLPALQSDAKIRLGEYTIDRNNRNSFLINYYGPEGTFPRYSFDEVIDDTSYSTVMEMEAFEMNRFSDPQTGMGLLEDGVFRDKIVIVGSTMPILQDFKITPFATAELPRPGFEVHAHAIQTIIDGNFLHDMNDLLTLLLMLFAAIVVAGIHRLTGALWGFAATIVLIGVYFLISMQIFIHFSLFMNVIGVSLAMFLTQVTTTAYEYVIEQREKRRIKSMFSSYVSPTLVNQMIESGKEPTLGGEEQEITAFFSDIVSFSGFSEQLQPKQLVVLINEYLTAMSDIINEQGGTLDKFIGDAIVAFYGAPVYMEDHAYRACKTTILMQKKLSELREKWKAEGWPELVYDMQHRIGLNTGLMVTGNMGSERRFNYTMMGDNVNLAARCESGAKQYHVYTMVTGSTKEEAQKFGDDLLFRMLDTIIVKGRTTPVTVYEILDIMDDEPSQLVELADLFGDGIQAYQNADWEKAISLFRKTALLEPYSPNPSLLYIDRCLHLSSNDPGPDWDGVFRLTNK